MVKTKAEMYRLLRAGALGNTTPTWDNVYLWAEFVGTSAWDRWGVRTLTPGGPCAYWLSTGRVPAAVQMFERAGHQVNISPMVEALATSTLWANVWDSPTGLVVDGIEYPDQAQTWRALMPVASREYRGVAARMLLERHLNANSLDDLRVMIETYPDHVIELAALDRCFGTVPGRNGIIWEVRNY